jgi:peptide/nickel transport system permease protein
VSSSQTATATTPGAPGSLGGGIGHLEAPQPGRGRWQPLARFVRTHPLGGCCLAFIVLLVVVAALAPLIAPYDPLAQHRDARLEPPGGRFLLGTDNLGRDVLSRVLYGARTSLLISVVTIVISFVVGTLLGVLSGLVGKALDIGFQRLMDAIESVPGIVLLLFIAATLGPSVRNVIIALCVATVPGYNRIARAQALSIRERTYVESARATGASTWRIMMRHVIPNMMAPMFTLATLAFGGVIVAESALSFLGVGTPPPTPSWGQMLNAGQVYVTTAPWLALAPATAISLAVFAFNLLGDALRGHFDPKMQG